MGAAGLLAASLWSRPAWAADARPALFLIGDSTVRNGYHDNGATAGQFGWGRPLGYYFDTDRLHVVNDAMGGTSSRSYREAPTLWPLVKPMIRDGDFVMIAFGHNDGYGSIRGNGEEERPLPPFPAIPGRPAPPPPPPGATMRSFGWYLRQYIGEVRALGATPIIVSLIPRNRWTPDGKVLRNDKDFALWARQAAEQEGAAFVPLNDMVADGYDQFGRDFVTGTFFPPKEIVHPNWAGSAFNASRIAGWVRVHGGTLGQYLRADPKVPVQPDIRPPSIGAPGPGGLEPRDRTPRSLA